MARTKQAKRESSTDQLVREHLTLAHCVVSDTLRKVPRHVSRDDLTSAALLGLVQAAKSFDSERGVAFARYARMRIEGALVDELRSRDWASRSVRARARHLQVATEELEGSLGRTPNTAELAERLGVKVAEVAKINDDVRRASLVDLDAVSVDDDHLGALATHLPGPTETLLTRERVAYLMDAVAALPERLRRVVVASFFEERLMQDIADELGVTESRVSQMRTEALALLKEGVNAHLDPDQVAPLPAKLDRVARRKAAYRSAVGSASDFRTRLDARPRPLADRVAALSA